MQLQGVARTGCSASFSAPPCRADRSNYDEHNNDDWENSQFDRETAALVLKVLTAKATQRLLLQLQVLLTACLGGADEPQRCR